LRRLARPLEALAAGGALLLLAVLATGGVTIGRLTLRRADEVLIFVAVTLALRALVAPIWIPTIGSARAAGAAGIAYVLVMGFIVVTRHAMFRTHALDLGQYLQVIWSIASGDGPLTTLPPLHFWGEHFSPIFYVLAPLMWVWPGAPVLLLVQTLILAAGALAVFGFAARRLSLPEAGAFAILYLVNPSLHGINIRDIHPQAFAIPLLVAAALAFDARRYAWCAAALVATLACREDAAVAVVGFGVWLALARRQRRLGVAIAVMSVLVLAGDLRYLMPYFRDGAYPHLHRYAHLGSSLGEILVSIVVRPWRWVGGVLTAGKLVYLLTMLLPLGFLPLAAPGALAAALPGLAMNLLSYDPALFLFRSQYQSFVLPFLVLAAVEGYARLGGWRRAPAVLALGFFASVLLTARTANDLTVTRWRLGPVQQAAYALLRQIPADVAVSANERMVPHLATRRRIFIYPSGTGEAHYVLELESVLAARPAAGYREVGRGGGWILLRRQASR
jgi:uncharacterized membrane protein